MALAEQAVGKSRVQMLWNIAPTLATVAARYVRREPAKAALAVLVFGGLLLVGRSLLGASGTASASKAHAGPLAG